MCSDPGQQMIIDTIKEKHLDGIIVAACSPTLHEKTFQEAARLAGLNPYQIEIANIREQDSWVHTDKEKATKKAVKIVKSHVAKARQNENLDPIKVDVNRRALVIGGGVSGLQAALDIADHGYEVILVEKNPSIGGQDDPALGDLPDARLLPVHPDAEDGRGLAPPADQAPDLPRSRVRLGLRRQLQGPDQEETPLRRRDPLQPLRRVREGLPPGRPRRVQHGPVLPQGHLHALPPGHPGDLHARRGALPRPEPRALRQVQGRLREEGHRLRHEGDDRRGGGRGHRRGHRLRPLHDAGPRRVRRREVRWTSSTASSSSASCPPRGRREARSGGRRTARSPSRSSSSSAAARATRKSTCPTARRSAACTRPSTP